MNFDIIILEKMLWSGVVGFGFAMLFNVPKRLLLAIFLTAMFAGLFKFGSIANGLSVITASLFAATFTGFVSIPLSRYTHTSPFVISIPSIIGMIPGYFGYKTLLGILHLALQKNPANESEILLSIIHNGLNMMFVLASLSIGVSLPWLLFKENGLKKLKKKNSDDWV